MKKFLAFGDGMDDVACAFPQLMIGSPENDRASLALLSAPQKGASIAAQIDGSTGAYIVGAVGNEWFILLTPDGAVGYAAQSAFWAGNG